MHPAFGVDDPSLSVLKELVVYSDANPTHASPLQATQSSWVTISSHSHPSARTVSRSSAKTEYRVVANAVTEASWLCQLLTELQSPLRHASVVLCDNISAIYMASNPVQHQRTKHIEIDLHFAREHVACGDIRVLHVPTSSQYADIFAKGLLSSVLKEFMTSLNVRSTDDQTAGVC
jgi:hypothetical protein